MMAPKNRLPAVALSAIALVASGCATGDRNTTAPLPTPTVRLSGQLYGGQQPVSGATIQLYAVGTSGYGSASSPLLTNAVATDGGGNFTITNDYTCPANAQVYIVATGGNPGMAVGTDNQNLALMAALGACSSLTPATVIMMNERTTVAAVWALSRFMSGYAAVGASASNAAGLADAFSVVPQLVALDTGQTPGPSLPTNASLPITEINTLSNILAPCINSGGGVAGDNSLCGQLFSAATAGSSVPQDTIAAALNIARNPGSNVAQLFALTTSNSPFQPMLSAAPQNFLLGINYTGGGLSQPAALGLDASGNVWVANANSSLTELSSAGAPISSASGFTGGGLNQPSALAIDNAGTVWVTNKTGNSVSLFSPAGTPLAASPLTGGGLNGPAAIAIDEDGSAWIANSVGNSLSNFSASFTTLSPAGGLTGAGLAQPSGIAINPH